MAYPSLSQLDIRTGEFYAVSYKAHGSSDTPVYLGQLQALSYNDNYADRPYSRVGGGIVHIPGAQNVRFTARIFVDSDSDEVANLLGDASGPFASDDEVTLNPDTEWDFYLECYTGTDDTGTREHQITLDATAARAAQFQLVPEQGTVMALSGVAENVKFKSFIA